MCVAHVIEQLRHPAERTVPTLGLSYEGAREELREVALALQRLCHGPLRGMFDAPTTAGDELLDAPVISLDLSEITAGAPPRTSRSRSRWSAPSRSWTPTA